MKHALIIALTAVILLPASLLAGEIYRWTDEAGNTHYSENPPPDVDARPMSIQTRSPKPENINQEPAQEPDRRQQQSAPDSGNESESAASDQEKRDQEAIERLRQRNCEKAREALKTLEQNARVQVEENGERRYLSPEEKEAERKRHEKAREENCN